MEPDFSKGDGLVPVIIQHYLSGRVLMLGYMNEEAWQLSSKNNKVTFYSRSKNRLWTKGEESGNFLHIRSIHLDCDGDTFLIKCEPTGPICHTGDLTCFHDEVETGWMFLSRLEKIIQDRKDNPLAGSYTSSLFDKGINKTAQKVGEEAIELVIEAKDNNHDLFVGEAADLLFHYLVLLRNKDVDMEEIINLMVMRHHK